MFAGQNHRNAFNLHAKRIFGNHKAIFAPSFFIISEAAGGYAAAGVQTNVFPMPGNSRFFKCFAFCRSGHASVLIFSSARNELPDIHIASFEYAISDDILAYTIRNNQHLIFRACQLFFTSDHIQTNSDKSRNSAAHRAVSFPSNPSCGNFDSSTDFNEKFIRTSTTSFARYCFIPL